MSLSVIVVCIAGQLLWECAEECDQSSRRPEAIVESPSGAFESFVIHYAETFIVPAAVGAYTIRPHGESEGQECATLKACVRT